MSDGDRCRLESRERAARQEEAPERVDAERVVGTREVVPHRADRLRADEDVPLGEPKERLTPASPREQVRSSTPGRRIPAPPSASGASSGATWRAASVFESPMAIEERRDADDRTQAGECRVEFGAVDRIDDEAAPVDGDRARGPLEPVGCEPGERAVIVESGKRLHRRTKAKLPFCRRRSRGSRVAERLVAVRRRRTARLSRPRGSAGVRPA